MNTDKLLKVMYKNVENYEGLSWLDGYTDHGNFRPGNPPNGEVCINEVGPWLSIIVDIAYAGTTMDQSTDRLSGDPYSAYIHHDWIGLADTAPKKVTDPKQLDEWAVLKTIYVRENTDVGLWGQHKGSYVTGLEEDGTVSLREADGRFEDVDPESLTTEKTVKLELPSE